MRVSSLILLSAFALLMIAHTHCLAQICPEDGPAATVGGSNAPADAPLCETEISCPAKDGFRSSREPAPSAARIDFGMVAEAPVARRPGSYSAELSRAAGTHKPSLTILYQIFRI